MFKSLWWDNHTSVHEQKEIELQNLVNVIWYEINLFGCTLLLHLFELDKPVPHALKAVAVIQKPHEDAVCCGAISPPPALSHCAASKLLASNTYLFVTSFSLIPLVFQPSFHHFRPLSTVFLFSVGQAWQSVAQFWIKDQPVAFGHLRMVNGQNESETRSHIDTNILETKTEVLS